MPSDDRPFRYGLQIRDSRTAAELRATAIAAEEAGFDVLSTFDHVGEQWPPIAPRELDAFAAVIERLSGLHSSSVADGR